MADFPGNKRPNQPRTTKFAPGKALSPGDELRPWLDAHDGKLVRVPVILSRGGYQFDLRGARLGAAPDALAVDLNDGALGVGLADRGRHDAADAPTCAFLVEAYWRLQSLFGGAQLHVVFAEPLDAAALAAITHAELAE